MRDREAHSQVHLPANRAFVVQFAEGPPSREGLRGRAEHLTSGAVAHFDSLGGLAEFVEHILLGMLQSQGAAGKET